MSRAIHLPKRANGTSADRDVPAREKYLEEKIDELTRKLNSSERKIEQLTRDNENLTRSMESWKRKWEEDCGKVYVQQGKRRK